MAEISQVLQIADSKRPESLQRNLYKVNSPYDLTDDVVTRSLNLLQNITGYDYRANPVVDIVERLIDSQNSELVKIGGERLLVEFGRRAANNVLDKFIPSPTNFIQDLKNIIKGDFKKTDASITDITKDTSRTLLDEVLQTGIGYRGNENFLDKEYGKYDNTKTSDVNFNYSGDMIKEKIQQLNKKSVFSTYNTISSKIAFSDQSLMFRNTYDKEFLTSLESENKLTETFTKSYFQPYEKQEDKLIKNYDLEKKNIEKDNGFGTLGKMDGFRTDRTELTIPKILSTQNIDTYVYDTDETKQSEINTRFGVRRGLVYFTSKLVKENPTISHNQKLIITDSSVNPSIAYYKGNGECRTFTIYDQYDRYDRVIKFNGNNERNSVLRDKVLPRIAPTVDDIDADKYNYFFTMENLALKDDVDDCEKGPNGGRWMWFAPYNVKMSDNNTINWSDMNFLGRPEPIFSYQNTVRNLSLSFSLLIDTVKEIQDVEPTIQNYYNYLYQCGQTAETQTTKNKGENIVPTGETTPKNSTKEEKTFGKKLQYYFKNQGYIINSTNPVYSTGNELEIASTINNNFVSELTDAANFLVQYMGDKSSKEIKMTFNGYTTGLISQTADTAFATSYNFALGMRRAYNLMTATINKYESIKGNLQSISLSTFSPPLPTSAIPDLDTGTVTVKDKKRTYTQQLTNGIKITIVLESNPNTQVDKSDPNELRVNQSDKISQRYAKVESIVSIVETIQEDRKIEITKELNVPENINNDEVTQKPQPCDEDKNLQFESLEVYNKFPTGFEKLNVFTPSFNSQTPFDFTKRYVFLHQLTRPSKLKNISKENADNTIFGRMPVFVIRYGDFIYSKAIARSINFDITESTWDLNPEGMGAIPLMCNVTMDLTLIGGQSLAGPIDRIQTANDSNFIANSTFNSGLYANNKTFKKARDQEQKQWEKISSAGNKPNPKRRPSSGNNPEDASLQAIPKVEVRPTPTPFKEPTLASYQFQRSQLQDLPETIDADAALRFIQEQEASFGKGL